MYNNARTATKVMSLEMRIWGQLTKRIRMEQVWETFRTEHVWETYVRLLGSVRLTIPIEREEAAQAGM